MGALDAIAPSVDAGHFMRNHAASMPATDRWEKAEIIAQSETRYDAHVPALWLPHS